jgi:hypothetical protein
LGSGTEKHQPQQFTHSPQIAPVEIVRPAGTGHFNKYRLAMLMPLMIVPTMPTSP